MKKRSRWIGDGVLLIVTVAALSACGGQAMPPPVALTNTPLPAPPTEAPSSTPPPTATQTPRPTATQVPTSTPPPSPTPTPQPRPTEAGASSGPPTEAAATTVPATEAAENPSAELAEAANQIYAQKGCSACHGANHEGGMGLILAGLPAEHIQSMTRNGEPQAGMPAFDQGAISDDDLSTLAQFLSRLTLQDIGVELPSAVVDHLSQAWDGLQAGDKAAVEAHLEKALEAGADAPVGVQATLKALVQDLGEADWEEALEAPLRVLLGH